VFGGKPNRAFGPFWLRKLGIELCATEIDAEESFVERSQDLLYVATKPYEPEWRATLHPETNFIDERVASDLTEVAFYAATESTRSD
jgi:hypothetical protein